MPPRFLAAGSKCLSNLLSYLLSYLLMVVIFIKSSMGNPGGQTGIGLPGTNLGKQRLVVGEN